MKPDLALNSGRENIWPDSVRLLCLRTDEAFSFFNLHMRANAVTNVD